MAPIVVVIVIVVVATAAIVVVIVVVAATAPIVVVVALAAVMPAGPAVGRVTKALQHRREARRPAVPGQRVARRQLRLAVVVVQQRQPEGVAVRVMTTVLPTVGAGGGRKCKSGDERDGKKEGEKARVHVRASFVRSEIGRPAGRPGRP